MFKIKEKEKVRNLQEKEHNIHLKKKIPRRKELGEL